jgi:hypothetical protein
MKNQQIKFNDQVTQLKKKECFVIMDYTTFHETAVFKLHDLDVVVYTKDAEDNLHHDFFGFFSEEPCDYKFTYEVLERFSRNVDFSFFKDGVHFWADNAFKSYALFYIFYCMAEKWDVPVSASFFAPRHGWSLCGTHFGHSKKKVRQQFRTSLIEKPENIIDTFKQFNNVSVEILDMIQESRN